MENNEKKSSSKKPVQEREVIRISKEDAEKAPAKKAAPAKKVVKQAESEVKEVKAKAVQPKAAPVAAPVPEPAPAPQAVPEPQAAPGKSSIPWRVGAFVSWALGIAGMVMAIIMLMEGNERLLFVGIGVAAVACIVGALLWKKANRISPCKVKQDGSAKSKILTFLWNQMGVVATFIIFLPIGLFLFLKSDKLTAKGKRWASIITAALVLVVGAAAYDYNAPVAEVSAPVSVEQLEEQAAAGEVEIPDNLTGALTDDAYWTRYGYAYHFDPNCRAIVRSLTIYAGTLADAIEAKKLTPCSFCAGGGQ